MKVNIFKFYYCEDGHETGTVMGTKSEILLELKEYLNGRSKTVKELDEEYSRLKKLLDDGDDLIEFGVDHFIEAEGEIDVTEEISSLVSTLQSCFAYFDEQAMLIPDDESLLEQIERTLENAGEKPTQ